MKVSWKKSFRYIFQNQKKWSKRVFLYPKLMRNKIWFDYKNITKTFYEEKTKIFIWSQVFVMFLLSLLRSEAFLLLILLLRYHSSSFDCCSAGCRSCFVGGWICWNIELVSLKKEGSKESLTHLEAIWLESQDRSLSRFCKLFWRWWLALKSCQRELSWSSPSRHHIGCLSQHKLGRKRVGSPWRDSYL